jgi:integrase
VVAVTGLSKRNQRADMRRSRRAPTVEEMASLLEATERRPLQKALAITRGPDKVKPIAETSDKTRARLIVLDRERSLICKTLVMTGLRYGELRSIALGQVDLHGPTPHIVLHAHDEKARRERLSSRSVMALSKIPEAPVCFRNVIGNWRTSYRMMVLSKSTPITR